MIPSFRGFTLIEVLIASFIMFIALAVFTTVFRGALLASEKAEESISATAFTSLIIENISTTIKAGNDTTTLTGEGELFGHHYQWDAQVIKQTHPPARYFGNQKTQVDHQAKLWKVSLHVINNTYEYQEISW